MSAPDVERLRRGARTLATTCAGLQSGERAYVIANPNTEDVAGYVVEAARACGAEVELDVLPRATIHGAKPPEHVGPRMLAADVVFCLTEMSMAHTDERRQATDQGTRYLSLPDYSLNLLGAECLTVDFRAIAPLTDTLGAIIDAGKQVRITTPRGTDVRFSIDGRPANRCPGVVLTPGALGSPPDAEVNVAPIETTATGTFVVDGSVPCREVGRLEQPVTLRLDGGRITEFADGDPAVLDALRALFAAPGPKSHVLGEFGIGLNPLADLTGVMLEDEGCLGTIHFGFGSNSTIGGTNQVAFHLDFITKQPSVWVDDQQILEDGRLLVGDLRRERPL